MTKEYLERQFKNFEIHIGKKYNTMPTDEELMAMDNNTKFFTHGYYSVDDNSGGWYLITTTWTPASRRVIVDGKTRYLIPIYDSGTPDKLYLELNRLGVRPNNSNLSNVELTEENTFAKANSDILDLLVGTEMMPTLKFPQGRFFFARPWSIQKASNLIGESHTFPTIDSTIYNNETVSGTQLCFPFLTNGQVAISGGIGGIQDIAILGNRNTYDFHIDRTKTITDPDNIVEEFIAVNGEGEQVITTGIRTTTDLWRNVTVCNFYNGISIPTSNTYINDIRINRCHYGITVGNDVKCKGIYGWDVHTLMKTTGSIMSAIQLRVDSCVNVVHMLGTMSGITLEDVDGDYCVDSLIKVGDGSTWTDVKQSVFSAIHGRCCAAKSYDTSGTAPSAADLTIENSAGYGIIHVTERARFHNNYVVINSVQGNPFDSTSTYLTPGIVFAYGSTYDMSNNHFVINDTRVVDSEDYIKSIIQTKLATTMSCRVDTARNTYYLEGKEIKSSKNENINNGCVVVIPEDLGAVGDGVTIDDIGFPAGNYIYQLTDGKTYRVSLNKLRAIYGNTCTGSGIIRFYVENYYKTHPYADNGKVLPLYGGGDNVVEMSARSEKNRLLECINHITSEHSNNTDVMSRYYRTQAVAVEEGLPHKYHGIGAVQHEYNKELPDRFTICLGRQRILTRKKGGTNWVKTIDELPSPTSGVRNYGLPWGDDIARTFNNEPIIVDDHLEVTVEKEEFTSWLGPQTSSTQKTEGNLHFWTTNHSAVADEFYDAIICQEAWVKEPEAANKLLYTLGIDCFRDKDPATGKFPFFSQIIYDVQHHLTTDPQVFYGCTMGVDGALAVDFDEISALMSEGEYLTKKSTLSNYNALGFSEDFSITQGPYTLSYDKAEDVFTLAKDPEAEAAWQTFDLTSFLTQLPDIKTGDDFRFYICPLEGTYKYQGTFYYGNQSIGIASGYEDNNGIISKAFTAATDFTAFKFGTSATTVSYPKFRVWVTKGQSNKGYQKYGEAIDTKFVPYNVVNEIIEERLNNIEEFISSLDLSDLSMTKEQMLAILRGE